MDTNQTGTLRDERPPVVAGLAAAGFGDAQEVGRGGFGVVYRCAQGGLDRRVAVKVLTGTLTDDRARFLREQQAMGRLTGHPNIVAVFQVGELANGLPFLVMPFCEQGCVQDRIARVGVLPLDEVLRMGVKMAGALAAAHQLGIIHRDVKPANILLNDYGDPALCDFGIARVEGAFETATGTFAGSPAFLAPEVISGAQPTAASDVYGLGASLFAALTGHAAFERLAGEEVVAQFVRIATQTVPDLREHGIPAGVAAAISSAMARDPDQRPSAVELGQQLQQVQVDHGLPVDEMALLDTDESQPDAGATVPAPAPGRATLGNLPAPVSGLVGRAAEMSRLSELVTSSRLVSVTGIGGIGKTTLATHAARNLGPEFSGGVWLVELAELRDATLLIEVISAALGVRNQPGRPLAEVLVAFLATRRVLLILDNCEHLVDEVAKLAETLLREAASLKILATSREALDVEGEAILALAPLPCPVSGEDPTLATLAEYEAVELFVERASAGMPDFALTAANAGAVGWICARLEGLPLALELAAARTRVMSVEQIAADISDRFALLTRGRRGAPTRQRTLAGCIDWSYELCTATEQRVWARLSVFAGSFELPAVAHLCAGLLSATECLDVLCALVDKSIVVRAELDQRAVRFRLLDTLRDYGQAHLSYLELHQMRRRHADWYQQLSTQAHAEWFGPNQPRWLARASAEMPNIREALRFSLSDDPMVALEITNNVFTFWYVRGMISECRQWLDLALNATASTPAPPRIRGLYHAVIMATVQADLPAAQARITEGRTVLEGVESPDLHTLIDHAEALLAMFSGELQRALTCFQHVLDSTDDYEIRTSSMHCMGVMRGFLGDHDEAMRWQERVLALAESQGDPCMRAAAQSGLAVSLWRRGESQRAEHLLRGAAHTFSMLDDPWLLAYCLEALAYIAGYHHDPRRAATLLAAASALGAAAGARVNAIQEMATWHDECERRARDDLGQADFEAAWAQGSVLSLKQAAAFAIADRAIAAGTDTG